MHDSKLLQFGAGAAIGLVVGFMTGLSISPVTSMVLGALSTGLLALLGFKLSKETEFADSQPLRVLGFGIACMIALVGGISTRTHQWLSPSLSEQNEKLGAIFNAADTNQILLSTNYGLLPAGMAKPSEEQPAVGSKKDVGGQNSKGDKNRVNPVAAGSELNGATATLLRSSKAEFCQTGTWERLRNVDAFSFELKKWDPKLANIIERAPTDSREYMSKSLSHYLCD